MGDDHQVMCQRKACSHETPVCARCGTVRLLPAQSCALLALRPAPVSVLGAAAEMSAFDESPTWRVGIAQRCRGPTATPEVTQRRGCCTARHAARAGKPRAFARMLSRGSSRPPPAARRPPQWTCALPRAPAIILTVPASDMLAPPSPSELRDWLQVSRELEQRGSSHEAVSTHDRTHDRKSTQPPAPPALSVRYRPLASPAPSLSQTLSRPVSLKHSPAQPRRQERSKP